MGLRSNANRANIRSSGASGGPVHAMDTEADGTTDEAQDSMDVRNDGSPSLVPSPPEPPATLAAHILVPSLPGAPATLTARIPNANEAPARNLVSTPAAH